MPRTKGALNKATIYARRVFDAERRRIKRETGEDVDPLVVLANLCTSKHESSVRVQAAGKLAGHLYPTLKAVEVRADGSPAEVDADGQTSFTFGWRDEDAEDQVGELH